jgi:hypothetical protein
VDTSSALQISNLKKHHNSRAHAEAAKAFVDQDLEQALSAGAPTADDFDRMLKELAKGQRRLTFV